MPEEIKKISDSLIYLLMKNDEINRYQLTRLFEDYTSYFDKKSNYEMTLIDINIAIEEVFANVNKNTELKKNKELMKKVVEELRKLIHYVRNVDVSDKKKVNKLLFTLTNLESLLKLDISYPHMLKKCFSEKLDSVYNDYINSNYFKENIEVSDKYGK